MELQTGDEDPFENYGLDFESLRQHVSQSRSQNGEDVLEHIELLKYRRLQNHASSPSRFDISGSILPAPHDCQLVFVQGYPNAEQINRLSKSHHISAEFWRRHLGSVLSMETPTFEDTRLPSAVCNIFQLKFWTIGSRGGSIGSHVSLQSLRSDAEVQMDDYKRTLRSGISWRAGHSVVRNYEIHDRDCFSIEQIITVSIIEDGQRTYGEGTAGWTAIICSDSGKDLHQSPLGPWIGSNLARSAKFHTHFFPVPEHRLWMSSYGKGATKPSQGSNQEPALLALPQSLANLPQSLREGQDADVMHEDPIYALHRLFSFYVCNEAYVLSFLEKQINQHAFSGQGPSEVADTETLSNLIHCRRLLERHVDDLRQALRIVQGKVLKEIRRPSATCAVSARSSLEEDLKYLIEKAANLRNRSETSMGLLMNIASIGEARRSVHQNKSLFRFTIIASVYVPLSFVATLFGMNFRQFGQGQLSIWIYFVVSVPVFVISAMFLFIDPEDLLESLSRFASRSHGHK